MSSALYNFDGWNKYDFIAQVLLNNLRFELKIKSHDAVAVRAYELLANWLVN